MPTHARLLKSQLAKLTAYITISIVSVLINACSHTADNQDKGNVASPPAIIVNEDFHADNDIAMTVRSLADAIKVGEPLDSTEYDFEGVLTDGQGTPLYTDVQGAPGVWVVDVLDQKKRNFTQSFFSEIFYPTTSRRICFRHYGYQRTTNWISTHMKL